MDEAKEVRQIPIEDIIPNRFQPRLNFEEKALNELSESIKQYGIIQPLVVRPLGDKFEIIAGERRYKAATLAGLPKVPVIVTEMDDGTSSEVALIENVQRKDLSSIEEAKSYKSMLERGNMTQEELAKKMGLSQSTIANKLRLLNLCDEVQNALIQEKISERHARSLLSVGSKDEQIKWLDRIIKERLTVRQLDLAIKDEQAEKSSESVDGDVPLVNINPDIENIINNAVDINPVQKENKPDTLDGIPNKGEEENINQSQSAIADDENNNGKVPNKFFNYLEDQAVNMSTTEEPKEETSNDNNVPEMFDFVPEVDSPMNEFTPQNQQVEEEIDSLEDSTAEEKINDQPIITVDEHKVDEQPIEIVPEQITETNVTNVAEDTLDSSTENESESIIDIEKNDQPQMPLISEDGIKVDESEIKNNSQETENTNLNINEPLQVIENNEFVFDDEDNEVEKEERETFEPIPIITGEGIVDPVSYFDTLDPDFLDKIKSLSGLDLKNAINSYREITNLLNKKGFNITIDEIDEVGKYKIEINITKE